MRVTEKKRFRFLLLGASGLLTGLTLVFPTIGFLEWLTLIPAGVFLLEVAADPSVKLRRLYGYGLFFFYCYYLTVFHWFVHLYPLNFIDGMTKGAAVAVVLVAWLGLSLLQALFGGFAFVFSALLLRRGLAKRIPLLCPFLVAGVWAVYEWTQTLGWWGVPWGRLPLGQAKFLVGLQTASWFGSYFVTFLLVAVNLCLAQIICRILKNRSYKDWRLWRGGVIAVAAMLIFQYGAGTALWFAGTPKTSETVRVAVIQGNISSHEKWSISGGQKTREVYRDYTVKAAEAGAEIVVWPETALPYTIRENNGVGRFVSELAQETHTTILVGAFTTDEEGDYNSIVCFTSDGSMYETVYSKRRLVPFGEFVPLRELIETLIPPLAELVLSGDDVIQGEGANLFVLEEGTVGSLICFDSIYETLTRESTQAGAELLCLSTNDSWFTDSAALYMHNAQAQLRAIESGRSVARAANTGISTMISPRGEVMSDLPPLEEGMLVEDLPLQNHTTLYTRIGNLFVWSLIGVLGLFLFSDRVQRLFAKSFVEKV